MGKKYDKIKTHAKGGKQWSQNIDSSQKNKYSWLLNVLKTLTLLVI